MVDFSKKRIDTLIPFESKSYNSFYIKAKEFSNDGVKIQRKGYYSIWQNRHLNKW